eukprot:TRINITY_DN5878_c0_g1_i1.p1 TRINITY_DN5878_c0_g1~~TRINITY_DN5878_c0_g1_i1.p1  ORF type:complete len:142 (+),score=10.30 TRINITY_DN5878_c0_g1_i1:338-763(+)
MSQRRRTTEDEIWSSFARVRTTSSSDVISAKVALSKTLMRCDAIASGSGRLAAWSAVCCDSRGLSTAAFSLERKIRLKESMAALLILASLDHTRTKIFFKADVADSILKENAVVMKEIDSRTSERTLQDSFPRVCHRLFPL